MLIILEKMRKACKILVGNPKGKEGSPENCGLVVKFDPHVLIMECVVVLSPAKS
jgi:hypothetical protein